MSFKILADSFSVARDSEHFIQLKSLKKPHSEEQVFLAVEIVGESKYARATLQNMLDTVEAVFLENDEGDSYERFEATLKEINESLKAHKKKRGAAALGTINAILALVSGEELYLTQSKSAEAYLLRKGKLSLISEGLSGKSEDLFVNIASGELKADDKVIFATSRLLRLASQSQLAGLFADGLTEALDALKELVMADEDLCLGVTCLHLKPPARAGAEAAEAASPWAERLQGWMDSLQKKLLPLWKRVWGDRELPFTLNRRSILIVLAAAVLLLVGSIGLLSGGRRDSQMRDEYRQKIDAMNQDLSTANAKGYATDKVSANAILEKVEQEAREILNTKYYRPEAMAILDKVQAARDSINNIVRFSNLKPYADLSVKDPSVEAGGLLSLNDHLFAFSYNKLYEVILDQVLDPQTIDAQEVAVSGAAIEDQGVLAFLTRSGRVVEYEDGQFRFASNADQAWKPATSLSAYGRNLYLLSPQNNQIYKYPRQRATFASASEFNSDVDLTNVISMAIDGNIFVLKKGGEILRLFKSKIAPFTIESMGADLSDATQIVTGAELARLYVLDPVNRRVVMIEKGTGEIFKYRGQLLFENIDEPQAIAVDKNEDKLYLLTKKAIYQVSI